MIFLYVKSVMSLYILRSPSLNDHSLSLNIYSPSLNDHSLSLNIYSPSPNDRSVTANEG